MTELTDKLCVVTGASSGIGRAVAVALAQAGARVVGGARRFAGESLGDRLRAGAVTEVQLDVTDEAQVAARLGELDQIDVLINNAGGGTFAPVVDETVAQARAMLETHILGTFLCSRAALPRMRRGGHIVNVSSSAAIHTFSGCALYSAAKAGQAAFGKVLREEARDYGVRVTNLYPGAVDTAIWDDKPDFDRSAMMRAGELAGLIVDLLRRPGLAPEEVSIAPPGGSL